MKTTPITALAAIALMAATLSAHANTDVSMPVPGASDASGRKVLTFIAKDPPGVRCNVLHTPGHLAANIAA